MNERGRPGFSGPVTFRFLNRRETFPGPRAIDWNFASHGKLWTYNLNYFEFLETKTEEEGLALIHSWIAAEATHADGWEPYPISLRLVSWLRFFGRTGQTVLPEVLASIRRQYAALWSKLEFHLGGNHLLENAIALCLTANFLGDEKQAMRASQPLRAELSEQYLEDGAHFELSGMYHVILLDRLLTLWQQLNDATTTVPSLVNLRPVLQEHLTAQLGWLQAFATAAGRYPHFNDSTFGIAPPVPLVLQRAHALGLSAAPGQLTTSGYRRWKHQRYDLWIDAAAIGPSYIPGHAHADNLTFVLDVDGQPCIVDPAISTYEKNSRRAWERSTAAHNTVTVAEKNSSDVWGGFRVGKRAKTQILREGPGLLVAEYDGPGYRHHRTFLQEKDDLLIRDEVSPRTTAVARFHVDFQQEAVLTASTLTIGGLKLTWTTGTARLTDYEQAIGWNQLRPARCLELTFEDALEVYCSFLTPPSKT